MKNKNLLSLIETTASLQAQSDHEAEFENLGQELATKLKGGQAEDSDFDVHVNGSCPVINNTTCGKG